MARLLRVPLSLRESWSVVAVVFQNPRFLNIRVLSASLVLSLTSLLAACQGEGTVKSPESSAMYDCQFETNKLIHLHVSQQRGTASVISDYRRGLTDNHADDVREARESEGRLVAPGQSRYAIELFLLNDRLGEQPGEKVILRVAEDGRTRLEGQSAEGRVRTIDFGTCSPLEGEHH